MGEMIFLNVGDSFPLWDLEYIGMGKGARNPKGVQSLESQNSVKLRKKVYFGNYPITKNF